MNILLARSRLVIGLPRRGRIFFFFFAKNFLIKLYESESAVNPNFVVKSLI